MAAPRETLATLSRHGPDSLTFPAVRGHHPHGSRQFHLIARTQTAAAARFDRPIHAHIPSLNEDLGLTPRAHQPLKFQKLGQLNRGFGVPCRFCGVRHGVSVAFGMALCAAFLAHPAPT